MSIEPLRCWLLSVAALLLLAGPAWAMGASVDLDGHAVLAVGESPSLTASERAGILEHRLQALVAMPEPPAWRVDVQASQVRLMAAERPFLTVTAQDLEVNQITDPAALAGQWSTQLQAALQTAREQRSAYYQAIAAGLAVAATLVALGLSWVASSVFRQVRDRLQLADLRLLDVLQRVPYLSSFDPRPALLTLNVWGLWLMRLALLNVYVLLVLGLFPQTRPFNNLLLNSLMGALGTLAQGVLGYLPNLVTIGVTMVATHYAIKVIRAVFAQMKAKPEELGFSLPVELIDAFGRIAIAVAWVFCAMIIAPLLPGLGSQTGQVIGLLVGAMITLGSGSTIGNAVAGLVLAYMRPFEVGDRVRVGELEGDVFERNFTNVRLRTIKNEVVTLTTQAVLSQPITNYTTATSRAHGLILHTSVTIGYDVPRHQVEALLIEAAARTEGIADQPAPFVLITALGDFSISYELNATTFYPHAKALLYSTLHKRLLDVFNEAGVEIMSPTYQAYRDGGAPTLAPDGPPAPASEGPSAIEVVLRQHGQHPHYRSRPGAGPPWLKEEPTA